jgi:hypothetical protein
MENEIDTFTFMCNGKGCPLHIKEKCWNWGGLYGEDAPFVVDDVNGKKIFSCEKYIEEII